MPIELVGRLVGLLCCPGDTRRRAREQTQATARRRADKAKEEADAQEGGAPAATSSLEAWQRDYWSFQRQMQQRREAAGSVTQVGGVVGTTRLQFFAGTLVWLGIAGFPFVLVLGIAPSAVLPRTGGVLRSACLCISAMICIQSKSFRRRVTC